VAPLLQFVLKKKIQKMPKKKQWRRFSSCGAASAIFFVKKKCTCGATASQAMAPLDFF
jgi:hypothetical protein